MSSNDLAISVRGLGKKYTIAHNRTRPDSLREAIVHRLRHPFGEERQEKEAFWALRDINFDVRRGEILGIIGRNGAGKSTLLKILSRIVVPTTGSIDVNGLMASLLEVGTGFHPELTGRENIFLNGSILGMSRRDIARKFDEIVAFAEIEKFLDTPVKRYSSGMYVRLAFSVAAHLDSSILIIDEVLAVGDTSFQQKCLGKVKNLTGSGDRTVLFVSHNLTTVRSLCDRVIWLKAGEIVSDGPAGLAIEGFLAQDMGGSLNVFDIEKTEREVVKETPIRLLKVTFNGGEPARHGEPLTIEIDYRSSRAVEGVAFGVTFASPEGGRVMCIDSDIPGGNRVDVPDRVTGRVTLSVPENLLQPSRYGIGVIARSGDNHAIDYLPYFAQIEIPEGDRTPTVLVGRSESGCVRLPSESNHVIFSPEMNVPSNIQSVQL